MADIGVSPVADDRLKEKHRSMDASRGHRNVALVLYVVSILRGICVRLHVYIKFIGCPTPPGQAALPGPTTWPS